MRIAIVDDIQDVRSRMAALIEEFANQHHLHYQLDSYASGEKFLERFEAHSYDIIFLDIYMDGISGTETAEKIREMDYYVLLIFLTTSREHMGDAFSCHAFDYLEKPADAEKVARCLQDALKVIPNKEQYFSFPFENMEVRLAYSDVVCLYADNHCTKVYDKAGKEYRPRMYYSALSSQLTHDKRFLQVSRGILCNMDHILELTKKDCTLVGDLTVPITLRNATQLKQKWRDYEFTKIRRGTGEETDHDDGFAANIIQFLDLFPAAVFCFLPMKNQLKYSKAKTVAICSGGILVLVLLAAALATALGGDVNMIYFPAMVLCFFCYDRLVKCGRAEELAVFFMAIALLSFMSNFAVAVDVKVHPDESIEDTCLMSTFIQFIFSCVTVTALAHAMSQYGSRLVDCMNHTNVWYAMLPAPAIFLGINFVIQPLDYSNMSVGRLFFLYLFVLCVLFILMILFYIMFYFVAVEIIHSGEQRERMRILEMQEHQYAAQQTYIEESARQRHDFRQSVITIAELVERNDIEALKSYLQSFLPALPKNEVTSWCHNPPVNALLNYYETLLKQNGVKLRWEVSLKDCKVSDNDLCGMLGNLLENVYHACLKVEMKDRFHKLSVLLKNDRDLYIVSSNSFDGAIQKKDGKYASSRRGGSGIGLSSIEITAEKYNGIARFSHEDKIFYIDVVMEV